MNNQAWANPDGYRQNSFHFSGGIEKESVKQAANGGVGRAQVTFVWIANTFP